jgi:hypothetical protein
MSDSDTMAADDQEAEDNRTDVEREIDDLYNTIEKMFGHLRLDNAERINALDLILKRLDKINRLQKELALEAGHLVPDEMTMSSIYALAVNGGSAPAGEVAELREANAGLAAERDALLDNYDRLTFRIKQMKASAADELIKKGDIDLVTVEQVLECFDGIQSGIQSMENALKGFQGNENTPGSSAPLSERLIRAVSGEDNPVAALLDTPSGLRTPFGAYLRRRGFAYDHKDLFAIQRIIAAQQTVLEQFDRTFSNLDSLESVLQLASAIQGARARATPEYQDALAQVLRLQKKVDALEEKSGTIEDLDNEIAVKQAEDDRLHQAVEDRHKALMEMREGVADHAAATPQSAPPKSGQPNAGTMPSLLADKDAEIAGLKEKLRLAENEDCYKRLQSESEQYRKMLQITETEFAMTKKQLAALQESLPGMLKDEGALMRSLMPLFEHMDTLEEILEIARLAQPEDNRPQATGLNGLIGKFRRHDVPQGEALDMSGLQDRFNASAAKMYQDILKTTETALAERTAELAAMTARVQELEKNSGRKTGAPAP